VKIGVWRDSTITASEIFDLIMLLFFKKKIIMIELLDSVFINLVWKHLHEVRGPCIYLMFGSS